MIRRSCRLALVTACGVGLVVAGCSDDTADPAGLPSASTTPGSPTVRAVDTGADVDQPIAMVPAPDGDTLFIAQRDGVVVAAVPDGDALTVTGPAVIDLTDDVGSTDGERGLLGLAVAPDGDHLYASYTRADDGASQLDEFELSRTADDWRADPDTRRNLVDVEQPFANHNGGHIEFGPDEMLYLGLGDGGSGGDPEGRAQDPTTLLGKLLRLDPDADPPVPPDNPFVGDDAIGARDEIWATGLRNPWRFSFDRDNGDLWIGDVGQDSIEEIDRLPAADGGGRGANLGWDLFEGDQAFDDPDPAPGAASDGPFVEPAFTYRHDQGCSVTGGVVYRGDTIPALAGSYLYADLCSSGVRMLQADGTDGFSATQLTDGPDQIVGFAQDSSGEVYAVSLSAGVFRLTSG